MKICQKFKECPTCGFKCFNGIHKCTKALTEKLFTAAKLHTENNSFITYDIESMLIPYTNNEDNEKYIREHVPYVICF
jgi:hypothetical protein